MISVQNKKYYIGAWLNAVLCRFAPNVTAGFSAEIMKSKKMDRTIQKSGLMKKEFLILAPFIKAPWKEFTLAEIKAIAKNKSHHYVFEALKNFACRGVITETRKGNTNLYTVNPEIPDVHYLIITEGLLQEERTDIPYKNIGRIASKIKNPFFTLVIGGSYADGTQEPASDLDIVFIIPDSENKKPYQVALREGELMVPEVHGYVFTRGEFYQMLANDEFNYGKELARKHIIYYGAEPYYRILFEAMKHGFKG